MDCGNYSDSSHGANCFRKRLMAWGSRPCSRSCRALHRLRFEGSRTFPARAKRVIFLFQAGALPISICWTTNPS
jgi:hypothetical protein